MILLPLVAGIALQVLTQPVSGGLEISGAYIYCTIPLPFQELPITESQVNSWLVMVSVLGLCLYLTHGLAPKAQTRRQLAAEWIVEKADGLVRQNMGEYFKGFAPFIAAILALSAFSSLLSLIGLYPPTSDLNVVGGWALLVFFLITFYRFKAGPVQYLKAFADPPLLAPLNVISEVATPVSMAFRHYGNVLSGSIISALVATALQGLSAIVLGWLPGVLGQFPLLQIGLPAILSVYFDLFSGYLQAFIFAMLTMLYVAGAFPADVYAQRQARKQRKTQPHTN
ncbi:MAG TPA: F0F1 ATP synthase subunit A [Candidatus Anaerofilum excrementigallinarum]|nr:F0F1 ATP synthase subunit A [Candidatus Anaerofilum excrementigallinarum]